VHLKDDPLFTITIPHKIFSYMASCKPILIAAAGDAADVVTSNGAGLSCPPGNPEALASCARQFYYMEKAVRDRMAQNGLNTVNSEFSRTNLVRRIEGVLLSVVKKPKHSQMMPS
jgi:colanic acid biosynthesis glycosyl transferase WcaI